MYDHSPVGKILLKRIPMGVASYSDIFQQKMIGFFHGFKFICAYIDELLVLTKRDWTNNVQKL